MKSLELGIDRKEKMNEFHKKLLEEKTHHENKDFENQMKKLYSVTYTIVLTNVNITLLLY